MGWERVAGLVRRRSGAIVVCVLALLAVLCLGNLTNHDTLGFGQGVTKPTNSSEAAKRWNGTSRPGSARR